MGDWTQGPWEVGARNHNCIIYAHGLIVAECPTPEGPAPWRDRIAQAEANARLIAAAPKMLEALETLVALCLHADCHAWANGVTTEDGADGGEVFAHRTLAAARELLAAAKEGSQ